MKTHSNDHFKNIIKNFDDAFMEENYEIAFKIIKSAENYNNPECYWRLGEVYEFGYGINKNLQISSEYYLKAINLGDTRWFTDLGYVYKKLGNHSNAIKFFRKGIKSEQLLSFFYLARMYEFGYGVKRNKSRAIFFYKKGASLGHKYSKAKIANFTRKGQFGRIKIPCGYFLGLFVFIETLILTYVNINDERLSGFE